MAGKPSYNKPLEPDDEIKIKASTLVTLMKLIGWKSFVIGKDSDISDDEFINQRNEDIQKLIRAAILHTVADSCFNENSCISEDVSQKSCKHSRLFKTYKTKKGFSMTDKLKYCYSIYKISKDCRNYGRLLKTYKTKKCAMRFMEKSIYRFCKEVPYILS